MIPEEICLEILIRLPVKSWFSLISKPNFAKLHLDIAVARKNSRSLIVRGQNELIYSRVYDDSLKSISEIGEDFVVGIEDHPFKSSGFKIKLVESCNGLVCLMFYDDVWGSSMVEDIFCVWNPATKEFKKIHSQLSNSFEICVYAFGYDCQNDDYKLFRLAFGGRVSVYTVGSNSWKTISAGNYIWLSYGNEVDEVGVEVWVMQDYGVLESWTKRYVITIEIITDGRSLSILWNFKDGEILFMEDGGLILYDPKHGSAIERKLTCLTGVTSEKKYIETNSASVSFLNGE
ncbi:F-box/kelch-repeat protein At3g06240-like [Papaver somniferum]|uniref:F-box/kelch-repeat protein At3g06240-like n=1 Tax=Papaver somniferum TaxID=3469 RepID=UPI000E6FFC26|nr:F-box/kelch-repeat protein At3g06240-like [Papaver somniferum]